MIGVIRSDGWWRFACGDVCKCRCNFEETEARKPCYVISNCCILGLHLPAHILSTLQQSLFAAQVQAFLIGHSMHCGQGDPSRIPLPWRPSVVVGWPPSVKDKKMSQIFLFNHRCLTSWVRNVLVGHILRFKISKTSDNSSFYSCSWWLFSCFCWR